MPDIEFVFLADAAEARPGQKFAVLGGGISRIGGPALPIRHPHLALVVGLRVAPGELGRDHDVGFQLLRPDGSEGDCWVSGDPAWTQPADAPP